jgi:hypothetical protein
MPKLKPTVMKSEFTPDKIQRQMADYSHIKGWGIDADLENDPTYPMKKRTDEERFGYTWERPEQQPQEVEILTSTERKNMPAVFGSTVPPSGLSGMIRRYAYTWSESDLRRWVPLLLADRINAGEGILEDIARGHIPNVFAERGWTAELKYNKKAFLLKVAAATVVAVGVTALIINQRKKAKRA